MPDEKASSSNDVSSAERSEEHEGELEEEEGEGEGDLAREGRIPWASRKDAIKGSKQPAEMRSEQNVSESKVRLRSTPTAMVRTEKEGSVKRFTIRLSNPLRHRSLKYAVLSSKPTVEDEEDDDEEESSSSSASSARSIIPPKATQACSL